MKEEFANRIMGKVEARVNRISDKLASRFKDVQPFDKEPVSREQQLADYGRLTPNDMINLIKQYGVDEADKFVFEMEQLKRKR